MTILERKVQYKEKSTAMLQRLLPALLVLLIAMPLNAFDRWKMLPNAFDRWKMLPNADFDREMIQVSSGPVSGQAMRLKNQNGNKDAILSSPVCNITKPGMYKMGLWAKVEPGATGLAGKKIPQVMLMVHHIRWKKEGCRLQSQLHDGWLYYTSKFQLAESDLPDQYRLRIHVKAKGTILLAGPTFEYISETEQASKKHVALKETARISFDNGLNAEQAGKQIPPSAAVQTQEQPGFFGKGITIGRSGRLQYPISSFLKGKSGAVAFWVRTTYDPPPVFGNKYPIGLQIRGKNELGKNDTLFRMTTSSPGVVFSAHSVHGKLETNYYRNPKQFFAGEWRHFVFNWDKDQGIYVYLDGRKFRRPRQTRARFATLEKMQLQDMQVFAGVGQSPDDIAVIDDIRLFNRALTGKEVLKLYRKAVPVYPVLLDYVAVVGEKRPLRVYMRGSKKAFPKTLVAVVKNLDGQELQRTTLQMQASKDYEIPFTAPAAGDYILSFLQNDKQIRTFEITAIDSASITSAMPKSVSGSVKRKLVEEIDCTKAMGSNRYIDDGNTKVIKSPMGSYREAFGEKRNSGFAYNFEIRSPGKPHWLEIEFPDNKPRAFYVVIEEELKGHRGYSQCGSLNTIGIANGINNPVTGKMQTKRLLFWPDAKRILVGAFLYKPLDGQAGPALKKIRLYENEGPLPRLAVNPPKDLPQRGIGSWNEDPTFHASIWFKRNIANVVPNFNFWKDKLKRQIQYLRFTGQNQTVIQPFTYKGDNNGAHGVLPSENNSAGYLPGWACLAGAMLNREKIPFYLQINERARCYGMRAQIGEDLASDSAGEAAGKGVAAPESFTSGGKLSDGFNFMHPAVHKAYMKRIRFYREQFKRYKTFSGILFLHSSFLTFRDEKTGYGDYTISVFEKETKIKIPVTSRGLGRFGKRYNWLKANAWDKWIKWRCDKVRDFLVAMVAELNKGSSSKNYKLVCPMRVNPKYMPPKALSSYPADFDLSKSYLEMGVDLPQLSKIKGLVIEPVVAPNFALLFADFKKFNHNLDSFIYSDSFARIFKNNASPALFLSRHANMEVYGWDSPIKKYWWPLGYWGNNGKMMAFSTVQPDNKYLPQNLAWNLANCNPWRIEHGWWGSPENGGVERYQKFYQAFRAIPAVHFKPAPGNNDPVMVRQYNAPDKKSGWFFVVNQQYYKVKTSITFNKKDLQLTDTVFNRSITLKSNTLTLDLEPYQVCCYRAADPLQIVSVQSNVPPAIAQNMKQAVDRLVRGARFKPSAQATALVNKAKEMLSQQRYSALYYLSRSHSGRDLLSVASEGLSVVAELNASKKALVVTAWNRGIKPVSGKLSLEKHAKDYTFSLAPEAKQQFSFSVNIDFKTLSARKDEFVYTLKVTADGKTKVNTYSFRPVVADQAKDLTVDGDLTDWKGAQWEKLGQCKHSVRSGGNLQFSSIPFTAEYSCAWSKDGLWLALRVQEKDLVAPAITAETWQHDSVEIMFDQANDATAASRQLDENDCVLFLSKKGGKPTVELVRCALGQNKTMEAQCRAAVSRNNQTTSYEAFFPAAVLNQASFKTGANLGFAFKVHNREHTDVKGDLWGFQVSSPQYPCSRPDRWNDLIFNSTQGQKQ